MNNIIVERAILRSVREVLEGKYAKKSDVGKTSDMLCSEIIEDAIRRNPETYAKFGLFRRGHGAPDQVY